MDTQHQGGDWWAPQGVHWGLWLCRWHVWAGIAFSEAYLCIFLLVRECPFVVGSCASLWLCLTCVFECGGAAWCREEGWVWKSPPPLTSPCVTDTLENDFPYLSLDVFIKWLPLSGCHMTIRGGIHPPCL